MKNICHNFYRKIIFNASALLLRVALDMLSTKIHCLPGGYLLEWRF